MKTTIALFLILALAGPLWILVRGDIDFSLDWRTADRTSTHIAPKIPATKEAVIQAYAARAFSWRGLFSVHTWIATKEKNADHYVVYQTIGWRKLSGQPPVVIEPGEPDASWYGQKPTILLDLRGEKAEKLISAIAEAANNYPYFNEYETWPGPNSNTFIACVARQVPELKFALPSNAIGKDFLPPFRLFAPAPSGTGYQFSVFGLFGILIAREEGLEINILSLVFGVNPLTFTLKLPGIGNIH